MSGERADVVVIGAGIAGSALAGTLARGGVSILVLERSTEYVDRVRGEFLQPWGVAEAQRLGILAALLDAGGNVSSRLVLYDEAYTRQESEASVVPLDAMVPHVPGALGIGHPVACRALEEEAESAGARMVRGVSEARVTSGPNPQVAYVVDGEEHVVSPRLVVGADGRESAVRSQIGVPLRRTEPRVMLAGLLVDGVDGWPEGDSSIGTEGDRIYYVFPQGNGRVRLYLGVAFEQRGRLSGTDRAAALLEGFRLDVVPGSERLAKATPAGPCAGFPMTDSWTDTPLAPGVALIGDAAGFSDPVIGQGLSVALRDARMVGEVLLGGDDWSVDGLAPYAQEREERMRRLRFCAEVFTDCHLPGHPNGVPERRRRLDLLNGGDPDLFMAQAAMLCGPEMAPPEAFREVVRNRLVDA
ncbi:MAG: FAD-dependent oxidoreductase [Acidimicrobiales bacterium]